MNKVTHRPIRILICVCAKLAAVPLAYSTTHAQTHKYECAPMNIYTCTHTRAHAHLPHLPAANVRTQQDFEEITCVME